MSWRRLHQRIDVPVQLVWGEHDKFFPVDWAQEMVGTFPDARLEVIAGRRPVRPRGATRRGRTGPAPCAHWPTLIEVRPIRQSFVVVELWQFAVEG